VPEKHKLWLPKWELYTWRLAQKLAKEFRMPLGDWETWYTKLH